MEIPIQMRPYKILYAPLRAKKQSRDGQTVSIVLSFRVLGLVN